MKPYFKSILILFLLMALTVACASEPKTTDLAPTVSHRVSSMDYDSLIDSLRNQGLTVEEGRSFPADIFSVHAQEIRVNGTSIAFYEYADGNAAAAEAAWVSPDGGEITRPDPNNPGYMVTTIIEPSGTPHYYRSDNVIVTYAGDSLSIISSLEALLGPQFAGGPALELGEIPAWFGRVWSLPQPEKAYLGKVLVPPAWLAAGDEVVVGSGGSGEIEDKSEGLIVHGDAPPPQKGYDLAAISIAPDEEATILIFIPFGSVQSIQAIVSPWPDEPVWPSDGRVLKGKGQHREDFYVYTLEPIGEAVDMLLIVTLQFDNDEARGHVTYVWRLNPPPETSAPTPDYNQTATAVVQALVSTVQPRVHSSMLSPDRNWRVETVIYDCTQVTEDGPNAFEQLKLIRVSDETENVINTQLQYCGGLGAYGFGGLYWSPNSRYFYYTDAREGAPDGLCWYWERPIQRLDTLTQETEFIGEGPFSPDQTKIAMWQEMDLVIWGLDEGEMTRIPAANPDAKRGPISWSPDSQSLVYLQTTSDCFPFGKSYVIRVDVFKGEQSLLLESKPISFIHVTWEVPDRITLSDAQGNQWSYDLVYSKLGPAP